MRLAAWLPAVLTTASLALAGCGGSETPKAAPLAPDALAGNPAPYTAGPTRACLLGLGTVDNSDASDLADLPGGSYVAHVDGKDVELAFAWNAEEGKRLLLNQLGGEFYVDPAVYRIENVLVVWFDEPGATRVAVEGSLR